MKIAFVCSNSSIENSDLKSNELVGAVQRQYIELSLSLASDHTVRIIRPWNHENQFDNIGNATIVNIPLDSILRPSGFGENFSIIQNIANISGTTLYGYRVLKQLKKWDPDVVIVPNPLIGKILNYDLFKVVFVGHTTIHDLPNQPLHYRLLKMEVLRDFTENGGYIIPLNSSINNHLIQNGVETMGVIPNGININDYGDLGDKGYILYSGRMVKRKNVGDLVESYRYMGSNEIKLKLVGEGRRKTDLKDSCKRSDLDIEFSDFLPRKAFLENLSKCSFFVLPSKYEGLPVIMLEAMASGKPVIASNVPGSKDIIDHGKDGFLFEPGDIKELSEYMELLSNNRVMRYKMGDTAREKIYTQYRFEKIADRYNELFNTLIKNGS